MDKISACIISFNEEDKLEDFADGYDFYKACIDEANELAQALDRINQERRDMQRAIEAAVHERIAKQYGPEPPAAIVLGDPAWHHGIVGIVAARIAEEYHRPTFLLQVQDGAARGSGRSIPAFDLYEGLQHCAQWLQRFGGHKYAAGLTMDTQRPV